MARFNSASIVYFLGLSFMLFVGTGNSMAQVMGELGEMDRLEDRAEEAIANGDAESAALNMGKAALMAKIVAQQEDNKNNRLLFQTAEILFRGQEQGYRALAMFDQAGGQPPAPRGVCQFLARSRQMINESHSSLKDVTHLKEPLRDRQQSYVNKTTEWQDILLGLQEDLAC